MQRLLDEDVAEGRRQDQRVRVGMYAFSAGMDVVSRNAANTGARLARSRRRREE